MENWAKTILSVYRYLENITKAIDNLVKKKCIYSSFYNVRTDIYAHADSILNLINRKVQIINLKVICEQGLNCLKSRERQVLMLYYVDGVKTIDIQRVLKLSQRSVYRIKASAMHSFALALKTIGYTEDVLNQKYGAERWLRRIYNDNLNKNSQCDEFDCSVNLIQQVLREYKGINSKNYG